MINMQPINSHCQEACERPVPLTIQINNNISLRDHYTRCTRTVLVVYTLLIEYVMTKNPSRQTARLKACSRYKYRLLAFTLSCFKIPSKLPSTFNTELVLLRLCMYTDSIKSVNWWAPLGNHCQVQIFLPIRESWLHTDRLSLSKVK